jgi:arginine utilization protein RocB
MTFPASQTFDPAERVRALSLTLVEWQSETGTDGEAAFADRLADLLRSIPYFASHPDHIAVLDSHGSPPRKNVVALVRGTGRKALALAGHYDTAAIANYRDLAPIACRMEPLKEALIEDLSGRSRTEQEDRALADLRGGDFLPGRALLDMKSGIAAAIAVLEEFAQTPGAEGNLVLMASPDEERNSQGMRRLRDALPVLAARWDLDIAAAINLDATSDQGDGREGRAIYRGTIGKLLPFAFVIGEPSHAAYPFDGISAHLIASTILKEIEANTRLCDRGGSEVSPPPICLEFGDRREGYEVTTPERVFLAFNWLFHSWQPEQLFERFRTKVASALGVAMEEFEAQAALFGEMTGRRPQGRPRAPKVMTFAELQDLAVSTGGEAARGRLRKVAEDLVSDDNPLVKTRGIVDATASEARIGGPVVVVGFASLHYPHTHLDPEDAGHIAFSAAIEGARAAFEERSGQSLVYRDTFLGISDMSFLGHAPEAGALDLVGSNTPATDLIDRPGPDVLRFPVVNIGPWGRDYHQRLERVHAPYAFHDLPLLLRDIAARFLAERVPS